MQIEYRAEVIGSRLRPGCLKDAPKHEIAHRVWR
jgi:hypothetical protein